MPIEPRDFALARNSAAPALASSDAASVPSRGKIEMPVVQPIRTDLPSIENSRASASVTFCASALPVAEQRGAGIGQQRRGIGTVAREDRNAGGAADPHRFALDRELACQRLGNLLRQRLAG